MEVYDCGFFSAEESSTLGNSTGGATGGVVGGNAFLSDAFGVDVSELGTAVSDGFCVSCVVVVAGRDCDSGTDGNEAPTPVRGVVSGNDIFGSFGNGDGVVGFTSRTGEDDRLVLYQA